MPVAGGDVQRIEAGRHRDAGRSGSAPGSCRAGPAPPRRRGARSARARPSPPGCRRPAGLSATGSNPCAASAPTTSSALPAARERHREGAADRNADGFAVERIAGGLVQEHRARTERRRIAERAAHVVVVRDADQPERQGAPRYGAAAARHDAASLARSAGAPSRARRRCSANPTMAARTGLAAT